MSWNNPVPQRKAAVDESYLEAGSKEEFTKRCTNSKIFRGKRSTVCSETTAEMHWTQVRMYLGWIKAPEGALTLPQNALQAGLGAALLPEPECCHPGLLG